MYTLYIGNKNYSSWSLRAWILLKELGIPFTERLVPFNVSDYPAFASFSPSAKVPCLHDGTDRIWGLQSNSGGTNTRFVFGQTGRYRDMSLVLNYSSSKVEGQGFGGNGHFMDLYVKYDPATRTGYGLRVERTATGGSNATIWTLYRYDGTSQTPLSQPLRTAAFMPKSTMRFLLAP